MTAIFMTSHRKIRDIIIYRFTVVRQSVRPSVTDLPCKLNCYFLLFEKKKKNEPFPKRQILDSFKVKVFADDNFKFFENGRKFSKRIENTVGKGEIARNEQFLLFPQCF